MAGWVTVCTVAAGMTIGLPVAQASVLTPYSDEAAFLAAIGTPFTLETWDGMVGGTRVTNQVPGVLLSSPNSSLKNYMPIQVMPSSGAKSAPNVLGGGYPRSGTTPPQVLVFDFTASARAVSFYLTDKDPAATGVTARFALHDGSTKSFMIDNPHPSQTSPIFFGVVSDTPILRLTLTAGFKNGGRGGYDAFSIDNLILGLPCQGDTEPPVCSGAPSGTGSSLVIAGTARDDGGCDSGIASLALAPGATNVTLSIAPGFVAGDPSATFTAAPGNPSLDGSGLVVVADGAGHTCTLPVSFRAVPEGPVSHLVLCSGAGFLFLVSNDNATSPGSSVCSASLPSPSDPTYPPGYMPSPPEDPFPCRVLSIQSPIQGLTEMVYKKDGTYDPRLRLLFSRSPDGGTTFPPFQDVTLSVEPILNIDPDPTRVKGSAAWSPIKVACALQGNVDCTGIDPNLDFDHDGFPLCPAFGSGVLPDCNDQIFNIHPGALEICNGLDDDCDGGIDEGGPGGGQSCTAPDRQGACANGTTVCVDGRLDCQQTVFPATETCNGIDDDCDGAVDEGLGSTSCGVGGCRVTVPNCVAGSNSTCVPGAPTDEVCNSIDDDCDGSTDEALGSITCGLGPCSRTVAACVAGVPQICTPGTPGAEVCDAVDNDCDGLIDEAWTNSGYLPPVEADGSGAYHRKQTIPFKFRLTDCAGQPAEGASATIEVFFYANGVVGTNVKDITTTGQANTDGVYRYDTAGKQFIYNLSTLPLSINTTYLVRTHVSDGTTRDVLISIIK